MVLRTGCRLSMTPIRVILTANYVVLLALGNRRTCLERGGYLRLKRPSSMKVNLLLALMMNVWICPLSGTSALLVLSYLFLGVGCLILLRNLSVVIVWVLLAAGLHLFPVTDYVLRLPRV